jgi:serine phosphatase RsbU (regulator of sigma subunit)
MLRAELALAREVQLALMPKEDPKVEGLDIAGMCVPAREVGGDLYEYVHLGHNGGTFGIAITDVSGKGMQAAMEAVFTSGAFAAEANSGSSTADVLTRLNRVICSRNRKGQFVAFLLVALDPASRTVRFCNAGQTKPLLLSAGVPTWLDGKGVHFPLGMLDNTLYTEREVILAPGDTLFLCTDGITDAMNAGRELFGTERLERLAARLDSGAMGSAGLLSSVTGAVRAHTGDAPQHDDMTLVVVRVL